MTGKIYLSVFIGLIINEKNSGIVRYLE